MAARPLSSGRANTPQAHEATGRLAECQVVVVRDPTGVVGRVAAGPERLISGASWIARAVSRIGQVQDGRTARDHMQRDIEPTVVSDGSLAEVGLLFWSGGDGTRVGGVGQAA